jgi:hypothetical protein
VQQDRSLGQGPDGDDQDGGDHRGYAQTGQTVLGSADLAAHHDVSGPADGGQQGEAKADQVVEVKRATEQTDSGGGRQGPGPLAP